MTLLTPSASNGSYVSTVLSVVDESNLHNAGGVGSVSEWSEEKVKLPENISQGSRLRWIIQRSISCL